MAPHKESVLDRILVILGKIFITPFQILLSILGILLVVGKVLFTFLGALVALLILVVALIMNQVFEVDLIAHVPERAVVEVNLAGAMSEVPEGSPLLKLMGESRQSFPEVREIFRLMKKDEQVKGVILRLDGLLLAPAQIEEVRDMIKEVQQSGKRVLAYGLNFDENGNQGTLAYYLACACDEIWLHPVGSIGIQGLLIEVPFAKKGLDKIGVKALVDKRHEYKNAPDSLLHDKMTDPQRDSLEVLIKDMMDEISLAIQQGRELTPQQTQDLINKSPYIDIEAKRLGLVDRLAYEDQILEFFRPDTKEEEKAPVIISATEYVTCRKREFSTKRLKKRLSQAGDMINVGNDTRTPVKIALLYAEGAIVQDIKGHSTFRDKEAIGAYEMSEAIEKITKNTDIKGLIVRLNTPGGSPFASEVIGRALEKAAEKGIKVIVSMGATCASGGYWIATSAHKIVAHPSTFTGSIGVYAGKLYTKEFWDNIGIFWDEVHQGDNAIMSSQTQPYSEIGQKRLDQFLNRIYDLFIKKVAKGRGLSLDHVKEIAKGRVWSGRYAKKVGLVDRLGGIKQAVELTLEELKVDPRTPVELIPYSEGKSWFETIKGLWPGQYVTTFSTILGSLRGFFKYLSWFLPESRDQFSLKMQPFSLNGIYSSNLKMQRI